MFTQNLRWPCARTYHAPLVTLVSRCAFDHYIVQQAASAGAAVYEGCKVTRLEASEHSLALYAEGLSWRSRYLALADGAKGTLRRQLGFAATAPHDIGLDMEVAAPASCPWTPETLYIDWGSWPQCYAWVFPKRHH